ncbi:MAG: hypothetical protein CMN67_15850 [Sphingomonadaceae bacterium]|nr:hypothetical protein [Sphingomonadaceae bacterium]
MNERFQAWSHGCLYRMAEYSLEEVGYASVLESRIIHRIVPCRSEYRQLLIPPCLFSVMKHVDAL